MPNPQRRRLMRRFGKRLAAARLTAGYPSAEAFCRASGLYPNRYRKYERGDAMPPLDVLDMLCETFNVSADWLLFGHVDAE